MVMVLIFFLFTGNHRITSSISDSMKRLGDSHNVISIDEQLMEGIGDKVIVFIFMLWGCKTAKPGELEGPYVLSFKVVPCECF